MRHSIWLAILLLSALAVAQTIDVMKIGYARIEINQTIGVNFANATDGVEYVNVTLLYPSDSLSQHTVFFESSLPYDIIETPTGKEITYTIKNPKQDNTIQTRTIVEVDYRSLKIGGTNASISQDDIDAYTSQGNLVIIDDKIRSVAQEIKKGTVIDTVTSIVSWTNQHMTYDKNYSNKNITTPEIIRELRGTCDELAHLSL
ncbi:MAG TPA: hypothetical protein PLO51_02870, partial [Candidatus Micrarchaeota archaeon]|nr:hypothetical protein [Candidatus Micrarchaeota archaeon]